MHPNLEAGAVEIQAFQVF